MEIRLLMNWKKASQQNPKTCKILMQSLTQKCILKCHLDLKKMCLTVGMMLRMPLWDLIEKKKLPKKLRI